MRREERQMVGKYWVLPLLSFALIFFTSFSLWFAQAGQEDRDGRENDPAFIKKVGDIKLEVPPLLYDVPSDASIHETGDFHRHQHLHLPEKSLASLSLADVFAFADLYADGAIVDFGTENGRLQALTEEWRHVENGKDGRTIARTKGDGGEIVAYLPRGDGYLLQIRAKPGVPGQQLTVQTGSHRKTIRLDRPEWSDYWMDLRSFGDLEGTRSFRISTEKGQNGPWLDFLRFRPVTAYHPVSEPVTEEKFLSHLPVFLPSDTESRGRRIVLPGEGGVAFPLFVPRTTRLLWKLDFERSGDRAEPVVFYVRVLSETRPDEILHVRALNPEEKTPDVIQSVDLSDFAGEFVRLEFRAVGGNESDRIVLTDPRLENYAPERIVEEWTPPKNVIVYLSDTLRWDKIRFFKPEENRIVTPNFDRIAGEGITFKNAISQGCWSKPSQAGIMTGRYPHDTNMMKAEDRPTRDTQMIATAIKAKRPEVITASYSSNGYVSDRFGFGQRWDYSRNMIREGKPNKTEYLIDAMTATWKKNNLIENPFFIWFGTIDPHVAYNPRPQFLKLYDDDPYSGIVIPYKTAFLLGQIRTGKLRLGKRDWHRLTALYDGEVSYNDHQLGELMKQLETWGILEETAIILISDHGDEFMEHGGMGHGHSLWDELVRVPFIVYYPRGFRRPRVVESVVETMDIYPTVLEMLGIEIPKETQAESMVPLAFGMERLWVRMAFSRMSASHYLAAIGSWRYMVEKGRNQLFDTQNDPYQKNDLTNMRPDVVYYFRKRAADWSHRQFQ